ncbi:uncharacterized protein BJX67DRAFT_276077 [Aspergillus lucknowensis]|uniref:Secreted protein n=1 Tax=Aspergillus lucknowensis TaxID=176173 RepID=A0ABR4LFS0_9EURO
MISPLLASIFMCSIAQVEAGLEHVSICLSCLGLRRFVGGGVEGKGGGVLPDVCSALGLLLRPFSVFRLRSHEGLCGYNATDN